MSTPSVSASQERRGWGSLVKVAEVEVEIKTCVRVLVLPHRLCVLE